MVWKPCKSCVCSRHCESVRSNWETVNSTGDVEKFAPFKLPGSRPLRWKLPPLGCHIC